MAIYKPGIPGTEHGLAELTQSKHWDYRRFRTVLIATALAESYLPGRNRPESIDIGGLRVATDEIKIRVANRSAEHARMLIVDTAGPSLIVSPIHRGTSGSIVFNPRLPKGREHVCRFIGGIHGHDGPIRKGLHASKADFSSFLLTPSYTTEIILAGDLVLMLLKTSVTPNDMPERSTKKRIDEAYQDFFEGTRHSQSPTKSIMIFTKEVCDDFGLVAYLASPGSDIARRVDVVRNKRN